MGCSHCQCCQYLVCLTNDERPRMLLRRCRQHKLWERQTKLVFRVPVKIEVLDFKEIIVFFSPEGMEIAMLGKLRNVSDFLTLSFFLFLFSM